MLARVGKAHAPKPMMHGRDQSDSPVRAMKSANNAERSAAESVEQRGGPKGKTVEPTTRRTQNRESVSPGGLRYGEPRLAHPFYGTPNWRSTHLTPDPQMAKSRRT